MKFCTNCGSQLEDSASFCTSCGATQSAPINRNISKNEYLKTHADPKIAKMIKFCVIFCYILLALNFTSCIIVSMISKFADWTAFIRIIIYVGLILGMHLKKSKGCAIALLVLSALGTILPLIAMQILYGSSASLSGSFSGLLWIAISIFAIVAFNKLNKAYKNFKAGN